MTELETLKQKKKENKATPEDLTRLKVLQDGEPLSAADLENASKREADRKVADKATYDAKQKEKSASSELGPLVPPELRHQANTTTLDVPLDHPRIVEIKAALAPFTQIEAHDSRPDEFVLFTRGISITAGDVRKARKAMKL